jgi:hypothetical protein
MDLVLCLGSHVVVPTIAIALVIGAARLVKAQRFWELGLLSLASLAMCLLISLSLSFTGYDYSSELIPFWCFIIPPALAARLLSILCAAVLGWRIYKLGADPNSVKTHEPSQTPSLQDSHMSGSIFQNQLLIFILIGGILIPGSFLIPIFGYKAINTGCEAVNRRIADQIIYALEAYQQDRGAFPETLDGLVPEYLSLRPSIQYDPLNLREYTLVECPTADVLLAYDTMDRHQYHRYNMTIGNWSKSAMPEGDWLEVSRCDTICTDLK